MTLRNESVFPRPRLDDAVAMAWDAVARTGRLQPRVNPSGPIIFICDLDAYWRSQVRVLMVGLNPSLRKFPARSPFKRFPLTQGVTPAETSRYLAALSAYFRTASYRSWFSAFEPLLNGARSSYYEAASWRALHTNLCTPVATDPTWSRLGAAAQAALEAGGGELWHTLLVALRLHIVVLSVVRRHLSRIAFNARTEWRVIRRFDLRANGELRRQPY